MSKPDWEVRRRKRFWIHSDGKVFSFGTREVAASFLRRLHDTGKQGKWLAWIQKGKVKA